MNNNNKRNYTDVLCNENIILKKTKFDISNNKRTFYEDINDIINSIFEYKPSKCKKIKKNEIEESVALSNNNNILEYNSQDDYLKKYLFYSN